jgi:hypothetical protein
MTKGGMILGTVPYMSPEQVQAKPVDHRLALLSVRRHWMGFLFPYVSSFG